MKYCYGLSTKCPQSNLSLNAWSLVGGTVWRGGRQCFKRPILGKMATVRYSWRLYICPPHTPFLPSILPVCQKVTRSLLSHVLADRKLGPSTQNQMNIHHTSPDCEPGWLLPPLSCVAGFWWRSSPIPHVYLTVFTCIGRIYFSDSFLFIGLELPLSKA